MQSFLGEDYYVSRSWKTGIEIQSSDSTKGVSARQIKAFTGADLLVCAGDYENDVTMIEAADIGYAVATR
jgi:hydroxymethylpyrimidine pyrophosphatase-like HAD family hydrolase